MTCNFVTRLPELTAVISVESSNDCGMYTAAKQNRGGHTFKVEREGQTVVTSSLITQDMDFIQQGI
jgi:hypothetical protein